MISNINGEVLEKLAENHSFSINDMRGAYTYIERGDTLNAAKLIDAPFVIREESFICIAIDNRKNLFFEYMGSNSGNPTISLGNFPMYMGIMSEFEITYGDYTYLDIQLSNPTFFAYKLGNYGIPTVTNSRKAFILFKDTPLLKRKAVASFLFHDDGEKIKYLAEALGDAQRVSRNS